MKDVDKLDDWHDEVQELYLPLMSTHIADSIMKESETDYYSIY